MDAILGRALAGLRWLLIGAAVAAFLVGGAVALGAATSTQGHDWMLTAAPTIGRQQAIDKALATVPGGTVISAELDGEGEPRSGRSNSGRPTASSTR